jgi:hypothetical protein
MPRLSFPLSFWEVILLGSGGPVIVLDTPRPSIVLYHTTRMTLPWGGYLPSFTSTCMVSGGRNELSSHCCDSEVITVVVPNRTWPDFLLQKKEKRKN